MRKGWNTSAWIDIITKICHEIIAIRFSSSSLHALDMRDTEKFQLAGQCLKTISSLTRRQLRFEGQHVQECGKHHGKYRTRFSCLLTLSLSTLVDRCVSHRCVFRVVALDRIIFPAETLARLAFGLVQCRRNAV